MLKQIILISLLFITQGFCDDSDWKKLFNGHSLEGWQHLGGKHKFEIIDGTIIGTSVAKEGNGFMTTKEKYKNFELKFDVMIDHPLNSGCHIRSLSQDPHGGLRGPQVEIAYGRAGMIFGELMKTKAGERRGWLSPDLASPKTEPKKSALKQGQWNSFRIIVQGNRYQTFINGILITDFTSDEMTIPGHIGLQIHKVKDKDIGKKVIWKNIYIKTLQTKSTPVNNI